MKRLAIASVAGLLFGVGLAVSGMTNPDKVLNFLDITGQWDPSLALVMGAALAVSAPAFAWMRRRGSGIGGATLPPMPPPRIDMRLVTGSALFGVGWGIAGYCPGPALANLAHGTLEAGVFVVALLAGSALCRHLLPAR